MSAVGFVLLVVGLLMVRIVGPSTIDKAVRRHIQGPTVAEMVASVMILIGAFFLIVGIGIKLWELMP